MIYFGFQYGFGACFLFVLGFICEEEVLTIRPGMFWNKKPKYYSLEFYSIVSLEEAKSFDIGAAAKFLSKKMKIFNESSKVKYSINYDRQSFSDPTKLDKLIEYSKSPEVVEITGLYNRSHFTISNFLLNQEKPESTGPLYLTIYLAPSIWNHDKYLEIAKVITEEFNIIYGLVQGASGNYIQLNKASIPGNRIIEMPNGHLNGIYNLNLLNVNQLNSQLVKPLINEIGIATPFNSNFTLWALTDSELRTLKKRPVMKNLF